MPYVDGYILVVPKKKLPAYRRMAKQAAKVWREHGALEIRECVAQDLIGKTISPVPLFPRAMKLKPGETVVFSWVTFKSRAHRDRVNAKVWHDPRIIEACANDMPFDQKRMLYGGFAVMVAA